MVLAAPPSPSKRLTYEDYMAEEVIKRRYDIVDGERLFMAPTTMRHQMIATNIFFDGLRAYQRRTRRGKARFSLCDMLITRNPLRTRQSDALFISNERYGNRSRDDASPLSPGPELVVEVLSGSDTRRTHSDKIADFCKIGVNECWLVSPEAQTVEILRLTADGPERAALYASGETLQSLTFPDLTLALDDIFRNED